MTCFLSVSCKGSLPLDVRPLPIHCAHRGMSEVPAVSAELLAQSQGPAFLQPGQLGDQIPMAVSRDRSQGDASSRQQNGPVQIGIQPASRDELRSGDVSVTISTSAAGVQGSETSLQCAWPLPASIISCCVARARMCLQRLYGAPSPAKQEGLCPSLKACVPSQGLT